MMASEPDPRPERRRWRPAAVLPLLAVAVALAYSVALRGEFQFDDLPGVVDNVAIRDLGSFLRTGFLAGFATAGRPVTDLTFAVDFAIGGLDVRVFHLTSLLLHVGVVALVLLLTRRTLRRQGVAGGDGLAAWIAALFALHPVQSQAVAYVSQRAELLASLFYLLALLLLLESEERGATRRGWGCYAGALLAFGLALGSKPIAVTLPAAWLLYTAAFPPPGAAGLRARAPGVAARASPLLLLSALFAAVQLGSFRAGMGVGFELPTSPWRYLLTQLRVLLVYLRLLVCPVGQRLDYDFPLSEGLLEPRTLAAALALAALLAAALAAWRKSGSAPAARLAAFGFLWFLLLLSPTSSVVPVADVIVEHRLYLASWGILAGLAAIAAALYARLAGDGPTARRAGVALAIGLCFASGVALRLRAAVWESKVALWRDVVEKSPARARAHENLGHALREAGDPAGALEEFRVALRLGPEGNLPLAKLLNDVGASLLELGRLGEAVPFLADATARAPGDVRLSNNLAMARLRIGDLEGAEASARRSITLDPKDPGARHVLGRILLRRGDAAGASEQFELEARLNPDLAFQLRRAALEAERRGDAGRACATWSRVLAMRPGGAVEAQARERITALGCGR